MHEGKRRDNQSRDGTHTTHIWKILARLHAYLMDDSTGLCSFVPAKTGVSVNKHLHRFTKRYLLHPSALPIEQDLNNLKKQNIKGAVKNLFSLINEYMK
jgi:hypothetical protein